MDGEGFHKMHPHSIKLMTGFGGAPRWCMLVTFLLRPFSKYELSCFVTKQLYIHQRKKITFKKLWSIVHRVFPPLDHARRDFLFCCLRILILSYYIHGDGTNFWQLTMNWSFKYSNSLVCSLIEMSRYALLRTGIVRFYKLQ